LNDARSSELSQSEPAFHWRWQDVEPLFDQAVSATDTNASERRVVNLKIPAPPADYIAATTSNNCDFQIYMPGEKARPPSLTARAVRWKSAI